MNEEIRDRLNISLPEWPFSVAVRSKARACGCSLAGMWVRIRPVARITICYESCLLSGGHLYVGSIPGPEEFN
jgi:hypothetical protein